ncbi:hypothetical protein [Wolbachia endosymbiont of Chironomus riparius]|uniref:hypothetical protein n=1 Tax=Wolbachia endosymbiont of Chironomus riparius TaxID=2883238 RepID=UPI00209DFE94|nr:hypothetical protein [Wolbachia endosymbiont of Chironomus riparius]
MTSPSIIAAKNVKPDIQVVEKDEKKMLKKEHEKVWNAFLNVLKERKQNSEEIELFTFILDHKEDIFDIINQKNTNQLSEENFCKFLLYVLKETRKQGLTNEKNPDDGKIQKIVTTCTEDARQAEAWDCFTNYIKSKIPGRDLLEKIPYLNLERFLHVQEDKNEAKTDTQIVTDTICKVLFPIALFIITALAFNMNPLMIIFGVISIVFATCKAISSLFSNDKEGTIYNPYSREVEPKDWNKKIDEGIDNILNSKDDKTRGNSHEQIKSIPSSNSNSASVEPNLQQNQIPS